MNKINSKKIVSLSEYKKQKNKEYKYKKMDKLEEYLSQEEKFKSISRVINKIFK